MTRMWLGEERFHWMTRNKESSEENLRISRCRIGTCRNVNKKNHLFDPSHMFHSSLSGSGSPEFGDAHSRRRFTHLFFLLNGLDRLMEENGWLEYLGWFD